MPPEPKANAWRDTELMDVPVLRTELISSTDERPQTRDTAAARSGGGDARRRASSARSTSRRRTSGSARPSRRTLERRARRRRRAWAAGAVLSLLALLAVGGLYQIVGRAPEPRSLETAAATRPGAGLDGPFASTPASPALTEPLERPAEAGVAAGSGQSTGAATPGMSTPIGPAPIPATPAQSTGAIGPKVTPAGRESTAQAVLPFIPGSQVVESDNEPQAAAGGGSTWAATLSMQGPLEPVVAFYRQQLTRGGSTAPAGAALTEVNPGPGQVLMSIGNPADGSHSAVWIGTVDGQVLVRLMRTQAQASNP